MKTGLALAAATALTLTSLTAWLPDAAPAAHAAAIPPPVHHGTLRVSGLSRDGAAVTATGCAGARPGCRAG